MRRDCDKSIVVQILLAVHIADFRPVKRDYHLVGMVTALYIRIISYLYHPDLAEAVFEYLGAPVAQEV